MGPRIRSILVDSSLDIHHLMLGQLQRNRALKVESIYVKGIRATLTQELTRALDPRGPKPLALPPGSFATDPVVLVALGICLLASTPDHPVADYREPITYGELAVGGQYGTTPDVREGLFKS